MSPPSASASSSKGGGMNSAASAKIRNKKKVAAPPSTTPSQLLDVPTELSLADYTDLLQQIRNDFSRSESEQELLDAARYNDIDVVRGILRVYPQLVFYQDNDREGHTALHMAAANGHTQVVALLLAVEEMENNNNSSTGDVPPVPLSQRVNAAGNTALHWAAANGRAPVVQLLLLAASSAHNNVVDVLQKNKAGRSVLTEGFTSDDATTIQYLLEHDSASEERLLATAAPSLNRPGPDTNNDDNNTDDESSSLSTSSVTHALVFGDIQVQIRELAMARHADESILGQARPEDDTTGLGIWASSLVTAQWMTDVFAGAAPESQTNSSDDDGLGNEDSTTTATTTTTILELGAGCGVPGLVAAAVIAKTRSNHHTTVYVTDFNPTAVANLEHNIDLNQGNFHSKDHNNNNTVDCRAMVMNWQDSRTWPQQQTIDVAIGSDLIYQSDMVPLLLQTLQGLRPRRFYYAAPATGRQGQDELVERLLQHDSLFALVSRQPAPERYTATNPLQNQDDEECFVHFHELSAAQFILFEFQWIGDDNDQKTATVEEEETTKQSDETTKQSETM